MAKANTSDMPPHSADVRAGRELLEATQRFAVESRRESWWHVGTAMVLLVVALTAAGLAPWWPVQLGCSVLGALLMTRAFITYHDYMHGAILRDSRLAWWLFHIYAPFMLTPPRSWRRSHNYHHGHVGTLSDVSIGAFPIITTRMYRESTPTERARYRIQRHPLIILFGYLFVFLIGICLLPLLRNPKMHWDSAVSLLAHGGLVAVLWIFGGFQTALFVILLPMTLASALGSYLFFAQHSFKRMQILSPEAWTFHRAAQVSSSYMRLNRLMQWFTGNIGFHHIHHLNVRIPFYRLPEAMDAIPLLQVPATTSLAPREIRACFQSSLWDEKRQRMIRYSEAKTST